MTDQQAGALPGVTVTVTNQDSGTFREAITAGDGSWFMAALPPGRYQVAAQIQGFKKFVRRDITAAVGNQVNVDIQLELGGVEEMTGTYPFDIAAREASYRKSGWTGYDPAAPAYDIAQVRREREAYRM